MKRLLRQFAFWFMGLALLAGPVAWAEDKLPYDEASDVQQILGYIFGDAPRKVSAEGLPDGAAWKGERAVWFFTDISSVKLTYENLQPKSYEAIRNRFGELRRERTKAAAIQVTRTIEEVPRDEGKLEILRDIQTFDKKPPQNVRYYYLRAGIEKASRWKVKIGDVDGQSTILALHPF